MDNKNKDDFTRSENEKNKANELMDFISNIKEKSAYMNEQVNSARFSEDSTSQHTDIADDSDPSVDTCEASDAQDDSNDVSVILESSDNVTENSDTGIDISEEMLEKTEDALSDALPAENVEVICDNDDFGASFNPTMAFYDEEDTHTQNNMSTEEVVSSDTSDETVAKDSNLSETPQPKSFERVGAKSTTPPKRTTTDEDPANNTKGYFKGFFKSDKTDKALPSTDSKSDGVIFNNPEDIKVNKSAKKTSSGKSLFVKFAQKGTAAVIAAVFAGIVVLTGGVFAAKGLITAFASDDLYGIFINGKLAAVSNQEGKIEEAIDDFLEEYKYLEEQGSLSNVRFSSSYEIRQLTREEIKEGVEDEIMTTRLETHSTPVSSDNSGSETASQTTTAATTTVAQTDANGNTTHATAIQENPVNKLGDKLTVSQNVDELKTILFYGSQPEKYTVVEGDNLYKIAKRQDLTLTELMVPNPDLLEDSTIGIDQEILVVKMSGPLKLSFSREVTVTEDIEYETVEEKTDEMFEGETKVAQEGKEGIRQEITKYDYEHNVIAVKTPVSDERLQEPVKKIVKVGTKPKTSDDQSSGLADSGNAGTSTSAFKWPVNGARLSSKFGPRKAPKKGASSYHRGIDLAIGTGTPIYATKGGTVTRAGWASGYGYLVEINHGGGFTSRYGHCSKLNVSRGQKVNQGDVIALVGNTGVSTGPHLHFEIRKAGTAVNPLNYLP